MKNTRSVILALALCLGGVSQLEAQTAPWVFGIGTGFARMSTEGSQGFNTNSVGPVQADFDLSPDEFKDLMETGFGFASFLTNGTWMLKLSLANITLGGEPAGTVQDGSQFTSDVGFEVLSSDFSVAYTLYRSPTNKVAIRPHVGARYTNHEVNIALATTGPTTINVTEQAEQNWTDFLVGTSVDISLVPKLAWGTVVDAGFGGSNGTYKVVTSLSWQVWSHLSLSPNASYTANDFENGTKGDADWYLYDTEDITVGLAAMFIF